MNETDLFVFQVARLSDDKKEALRKRRCLNPRSEKVRDERFQDGGFFDSLDLLQVKYEMLRRAGEEGKPVTQAAAEFGFSRPVPPSTRSASASRRKASRA